jgi:hypothetical protein
MIPRVSVPSSLFRIITPRRPPPVVLILFLLTVGAATVAAPRPVLTLPTANQALFEPGAEARFFAPTPGRSWTAGRFGCVRSEGRQMHEGIDILALHHDANREPLDTVHAAADGEVAYINRKAGLSNYGIYVVLRHRPEGLEVYTLYAHLREVLPAIQPGIRVRQGDTIGVLGRTTNTSTPIAKDRAHVHFEICLLLNPRFPEWLRRHYPGTPERHGMFNGRNLLGLDPEEIFRRQHREGAGFSLLACVRHQPEMFRMLLAGTSFPWLHRYPILIQRNRVAEREGIAAYEAAFDANGIPFRLAPRAMSQIEGPLRTRLLQVNEEEYRRKPCRRLISRKGPHWELTSNGRQLISLLMH